tara:strand:- start:23681 stop:24700 length:1020 start_codon:yes stop_codon:yes gene_type:complete
MVNPDIESGLAGEIMARSNNPPAKCDISIQVQLPNEWDPNLANINIGVSAFVETDVCNPEWINACNKMDCIVVPSQHVRRVIENSGKCNVPVHVVPESFYEDIEKEDLDPIDIKFETDFNFLVFGQLTGNNPYNDRKNLFNTIKWICDEFKDDPDVGIVLKTNSGKNTKIDRKITSGIVQQLVSEIREGPYPKVHMIHGAMSTKEVASLYRHPQISALVSLTRGEGFGLPILEAAASGLPVIATAWSGHVDFLRLGKYVSVDYQLSPIHETRVDNQIFMQNARWAEASSEHARARLRKFRKSNVIPKQWAKELREKLLTTFNQGSINSLYDSAIGKYFV